MLCACRKRIASVSWRSRGSIRWISSEESSRPFPAPYPTRPVPEEEQGKEAGREDQEESPTMAQQEKHIGQQSLLQEQQLTPYVLKETPVQSQANYERYRLHHFDTYNLLVSLENHGFTRNQARVLMGGIKHRLRQRYAMSLSYDHAMPNSYVEKNKPVVSLFTKDTMCMVHSASAVRDRLLLRSDLENASG